MGGVHRKLFQRRLRCPVLCRIQPITQSLVPIMFTTGSADTLVPPRTVKAVYDKTADVPKVFAEIQGGGHNEPTTKGQNRLESYMIAMMDCHLRNNAAQCDM